MVVKQGKLTLSYIVAFVRFAPNESPYPVNCWRSDVREGDVVVVRMKSRGDACKRAEVVHLAYLNWRCANSIECIASEAQFTPHGIIPPDPPRMHYGVNRPVDDWNVIRVLGWRNHRTRSKTYQFACSARNDSFVCYMFFRRNGVDIQIMIRPLLQQQTTVYSASPQLSVTLTELIAGTRI